MRELSKGNEKMLELYRAPHHDYSQTEGSAFPAEPGTSKEVASGPGVPEGGDKGDAARAENLNFSY